ncbi:MAG: acetyl-CoA carboxylase biotin carboxylase subunit [Eubacteriaceae bacterium]|nr:acetyl-CoA carboxylase biotin carboxylase subunit [Eubacteriaceae bacterium]
MFSKILIANRGEVAVRIIRACKEMGIISVAVYSEADKESIHISMADECVCVGGALSKDSYLNQQAIITAAQLHGCEAIHPGYGFLAENAQFANLCKENGIVFIGPPAELIAQMGDKDAARRMMQKADVPVVPGSDLIESYEAAVQEAARIGYPILIKAKAGGGGRGIRLVESEDELENAFLTATAEAKSAFGDGSVYMEKYLSPVKHIEVQVLADEYGNVLALGERECSIQLKNQKILEESPSTAIDAALREKLFSYAIKAVKAVKYTNAGTIEFLLDTENNIYFMEMNTRLQVEHPVTEMITGIDIVKWQIRIAAGVALSYKQSDIRIGGCAIECRINASSMQGEGTGKGIEFFHVPGGPAVRFDTFLYQGYKIVPFYDSLLGKVIVYAKTREEAIRKMQAALCELVIEGVETNIVQQTDILSEEAFKTGQYYTNFMENRG